MHDRKAPETDGQQGHKATYLVKHVVMRSDCIWDKKIWKIYQVTKVMHEYAIHFGIVTFDFMLEKSYISDTIIMRTIFNRFVQVYSENIHIYLQNLLQWEYITTSTPNVGIFPTPLHWFVSKSSCHRSLARPPVQFLSVCRGKFGSQAHCEASLL